MKKNMFLLAFILVFQYLGYPQDSDNLKIKSEVFIDSSRMILKLIFIEKGLSQKIIPTTEWFVLFEAGQKTWKQKPYPLIENRFCVHEIMIRPIHNSQFQYSMADVMYLYKPTYLPQFYVFNAKDSFIVNISFDINHEILSDLKQTDKYLVECKFAIIDEDIWEQFTTELYSLNLYQVKLFDYDTLNLKANAGFIGIIPNAYSKLKLNKNQQALLRLATLSKVFYSFSFSVKDVQSHDE